MQSRNQGQSQLLHLRQRELTQAAKLLEGAGKSDSQPEVDSCLYFSTDQKGLE